MRTILQYATSITCPMVLCAIVIISCSEDGGGDAQLSASAGDDMNAKVGQLVTLNGGASRDSHGNAFEFSWRFIGKPSASTARLQNADAEKPTFTPDVQGKYKIELTVSNTVQSLDTVTVAAFSVEVILGNYTNITPGPNVGIRDFETVCDTLYATCEFTEIGGIDANKIAGFDNKNWFALSCGLEEGSIYDMVDYKCQLYVTGRFSEIGCVPANNIARWNGKKWIALKAGLTGGDDPYGHALIVYQDELYVGGKFTMAGDIPASNTAKWDGNDWSAVGNIENGSVRELQVYQQKLYAGGFFTSVNGNTTEYIASYNGTTWSALGSRDALEHRSTGAVKHMTVYKDILYISGDFSVDSNDNLSELITWNGAQFNDFGRAFSLDQNNTIYELSVIDGILYIGGSFRNVVASEANNIIQWDGQSWGVLGTGTSGTVLSIEPFKGKLFIGGDFDKAGGSAAENIAVWKEN